MAPEHDAPLGAFYDHENNESAPSGVAVLPPIGVSARTSSTACRVDASSAPTAARSTTRKRAAASSAGSPVPLPSTVDEIEAAAPAQRRLGRRP